MRREVATTLSGVEPFVDPLHFLSCQMAFCSGTGGMSSFEDSHSLRGSIRQHVVPNGDWSVGEIFSQDRRP